MSSVCIVFPSLELAIASGYQVVEPIPEGYLVRIMTPGGWAFVLVVMEA